MTELTNTAINHYNDKMKEMINGINQPRLIWLDVARTISKSPTGDLLVPDGTHMNWEQKYSKMNDVIIRGTQELPLIATHYGIVNTMLNMVCGDFVDDKEACCNKFD